MIKADKMMIEAATKDMWQKLLQPKHFLLYEQAVDHEEYKEHVDALRKWVSALFESEFNVHQATRRINPFVSFDDLPEMSQKSNAELAKALHQWYRSRK